MRRYFRITMTVGAVAAALSGCGPETQEVTGSSPGVPLDGAVAAYAALDCDSFREINVDHASEGGGVSDASEAAAAGLRELGATLPRGAQPAVLEGTTIEGRVQYEYVFEGRRVAAVLVVNLGDDQWVPERAVACEESEKDR